MTLNRYAFRLTQIGVAVAAALVLVGCGSEERTADWIVDSSAEWSESIEDTVGFDLQDGLMVPTAPMSFYRSTIKTLVSKRKASSILFEQAVAWDNWIPVPNVGPEGAKDAPIFLPIADANYWFFAEHPDLGDGYHAWQSRDMQTWVHKGVASPLRWATTAEYADDKIYLYFDKPNDQDPHLLIGENLDGNVTWREVGKVFDDPTHGSDAGVIRLEDGSFHLIYEDWSPLDASTHSWDSPLAGHADSPDGINGFAFGDNPPAIDHRTIGTGETGYYNHSFTSDEPLEYEIHEPDQNAYGDFSLTKVGSRIYLFSDYHPHDGDISIGYFTSSAIDEPFELTGSIGQGHPDPTIGFAEGQFYLIIQRGEVDYVSPGPWVNTVEARAGVDVDGDGMIDQWTDWTGVRESYSKKPGFARIVDVDPAILDLDELPSGVGFQFEFRTSETETGVQPIMDRVTFSF